MQTLGILGGMGPAAGVHFAKQLVDLNTQAGSDGDHLPFILVSNPAIPSRVDAYMAGAPDPSPQIAASCNMLHAQGADFGVIVCSTAHIFFKDVQRRTSLPLLSLVEVTVDHITRNCVHGPIAVLGTDATVRSGLYSIPLGTRGIDVVHPSPQRQQEVSAAIFHPQYGLKAKSRETHQRALEALTKTILSMREEAGIASILLGCTELSLAIREESWEGLTVIDPTKILALACLRKGMASEQRSPDHVNHVTDLTAFQDSL